MANPVTVVGGVYGFPGSLTTGQWALYQGALGEVNNRHGVVTGLNVTATGATREVSISAGESVVPGLRIAPSGAQLVTGPANTSGTARVDLVVLEADWLANTQAGVAQYRIITGSSPVNPPTVTQTPGTLWQMPLATILARNGVATYAAGDLTAVKPRPRWAQRYTNVPAVLGVRGTQTWRQLAAIDIGDPGWPYLLDVRGSMLFEGIEGVSPYGLCRAYDQVAQGYIAQGRTGNLNAGGLGATNARESAQFSDVSGTLTGARTITFEIAMTSAPETTTIDTVDHPSNYFTVVRLPAAA